MLRQWAPFEELAKAFAEGDVCLRVAGLVPAARALAVAELRETPPRAALVIVKGLGDAHRWAQDLKFFRAPVAGVPEQEPPPRRGGPNPATGREPAGTCPRRLPREP